MILLWLRRAFGVVVALVVLFEEWGWDWLQALLARLARWPPLGRLEAWIATLPPRAAVVLFFLPMLLLLPAKIGALWLIGAGHVLLGLLIVLVAKLVGTALVARLFTLMRPALLRLPWFARAYERWTAWKDHWIGRVRRSLTWRRARVARRRIVRYWRALTA
jgi:hypothetical protein